MTIHESSFLVSVLTFFMYIFGVFIEPQLSGILGALAYFIVRHELKIELVSFKGLFIIMFFGWMGAWASVNLMQEHFVEIPYVWCHITSATVGFLSYDAIMLLGANRISVLAMVVDTVKSIIEKWRGR